MSFTELINFSAYPIDTDRFDNDWQAIAAYTRAHGVDGLELLIGYDPLPRTPPGLVRGVHLPFWITWLDVWRDVPGALGRYFPDLDPAWLQFYCGGRTSTEIIETMGQTLRHAAALDPAYAVFHVSHVEPAHAFTRAYPYTSREVIAATVDLLNTVAATFAGGEPPVRLFLENLWWPGLTFTNIDETTYFFEALAFDNWAFVLDTGHLMNTCATLTEEEAAIDYVLERISQLPANVVERIEGIHLNLSISGDYQQRTLPLGLPPGFARMTMPEQLTLSRSNALHIDQHRPFSHPRCREIIEAVRPRFVTHEFLSETQAEFDQKLRVQRAALHPDR